MHRFNVRDIQVLIGPGPVGSEFLVLVLRGQGISVFLVSELTRSGLWIPEKDYRRSEDQKGKIDR